jgi:ABC-type polysaccharide/polyol phosphate export permease
MTTIYDSKKRRPIFLEELMGVIHYRDLIFQLVRRDIVTRYKRSALGIAWTMLNPLGMMIVLTLVFSNIFHSIHQYPAYVLSGLIAWNFFSQTTAASMTLNVWGGSLLHRIYLPRSSFTVSAIGTGLVNLVFSIPPLVIIMLIIGTPLRWTILFLPYSILLLAAFALGIGLLLSSWATSFPDVVEMYQVALMAWMYLTPIIYPQDIIPVTYRLFLVDLNPMYYLIQIFRLPIYEGILPPLHVLMIGTGLALITFLLGWTVFSKNADKLNYRT